MSTLKKMLKKKIFETGSLENDAPQRLEASVL